MVRVEKRKLVPGILVLLIAINLDAQIDIAAARQLPPGSIVTIEGVAINGPELGQVRYLQDSTAGIAAFPGTGSASGFEGAVREGYKVRLTGVLSKYLGLLEISPILSYEIQSTGIELPEPEDVAVTELGPQNEGQLVRLSCLAFADAQAKVQEGKNQVYDRNGDEIALVADQDSDASQFPLANTAYSVIAVSSYANGPRLLLRHADDLTPESCFYLRDAPVLTSIEPHSLSLNWETNLPANGFLVYSATGSQLQDTSQVTALSLSHDEILDNLEASTFYKVKGCALTQENDTACSPFRFVTTASLSSGEIKVYFNKSIDTQFSNGAQPDGTDATTLLNALISLIDRAQSTVDIALYSNGRFELLDALKRAHNRGVRVRYITDPGPSNSVLSPSPPFPLFITTGNGLMHHKFVVIDVDSEEKAWVWTGSTNFSTNQVFQDPNNSICLQDRALAKAYTVEFEEIWGSDTAQPNSSLGRRGSAKVDNTPHEFNIGGIRVENYFSPSDRTGSQILRTINSADKSLMAGLLLLTREEMSNAMIDRHDNGVYARVIIDDDESSGFNISILQSNGVPVKHHYLNPIFHHKYVIVDPDDEDSDPVVLTGSHNWTFSADNINDENILIIHDKDIANMYHQEFEARWSEVTTSVANLAEQKLLVMPNPTSGEIQILTSVESGSFSLSIINSLGLEVKRVRVDPGLRNIDVDIRELPAGYYLLVTQGLPGIPIIKI